MADTRTLTIKFKADGAQEVSRVVKEIKKDGDTVYTKILKDGKLVSETFRTNAAHGRSFASALTAISTGYLAASQAIGSATRILGGWVDAAREEERSIQRRRVALVGASAEQVQALEAQAQAYLNLYGIADDVTRQAQAQASLMGIHAENIDEVTRAALGLTEIYGGELPDNIEKVSRFLLTNQKQIKGTSIVAKEGATFLDKLGVAAERTADGIRILDDRMKTDEGQLERSAAKWDELKESLGQKLLPVVSDVAAGFENLLDWYNALDPGAQNVVSWSAAASVALGPVALTLAGIAQTLSALKNLGWLGAAGTAGRAGLGAGAGLLTWLWPSSLQTEEHERQFAPIQAMVDGKMQGFWNYAELEAARASGGGGGGAVNQPTFGGGGGAKKPRKPRVFRGKIEGFREGVGGLRTWDEIFEENQAIAALGNLSLSGGLTATFQSGARKQLGMGTQPSPYPWGALAMADYAHPGGINEFFQYNDQVSKPGWRQKLGGAFDQQGIASVAGGFLGGGLQGGISSAFGLAGSAVGGPIGGLVGGLVGNLFGGLFGKKKRQNRDGQSQATALIVQSQQLEDIRVAILRLAPSLRQAGAGINSTVRQIALQAGR